ncbi:MAG: Coenzyme F420 hydrogenase/dehydrogenase, beta subunit C-terminal domain [Nitrososphaerota archaeon]|nr:Coenzyme F420 hydrogenase/dehydrogenase, beta subunit C-terminal domain [Aigarchaeota archaeon]MDW8076866.1 Coenzyme F420 hydrogenase/dehydrogenase, beta subunit C-terminal domain [Nitrososphaerota archaeon]
MVTVMASGTALSYNPNFELLNRWVIEKQLCCYCGTCAGVCPRITLDGKIPRLIDYCSECGNCYIHCPQTYTPVKEIEKKIFPGTNKDEFIGHYEKCILAQSTDQNILSIAQNGGLVTTLLTHALETGLIDGAILTIADGNWMPRPILARTPEEIRKAAGSKYVMCPNLFVYREVINDPTIRRVAVVGLPCQVKAARKLQVEPVIPVENGKIEFIIGLFCHRNFSYDELILETVKRTLNIDIPEIKKFDISRGKFMVFTKEGKRVELPVKELSKYSWPSCSSCTDFTGRLADISVGNAGTMDTNWSVAIVRSKKGMEFLDSALKAGKLRIAESGEGINNIAKEAQKKAERREKVSELLYQYFSELGVPLEDVRAYFTLLTLGGASAAELSKALNISGAELDTILARLYEKGWLIKHEGYYVPIRPSIVLRTEAMKLHNLIKKILEKESELEGIYARKFG